MIKQLILFLIVLFSCSQKQHLSTHEDQVCNKESALSITDKLFKLKGFKKKYYDTVVNEYSTLFIITYELKGDNYGGGALFKVSKRSCGVIEKKYYQ